MPGPVAVPSGPGSGHPIWQGARRVRGGALGEGQVGRPHRPRRHHTDEEKASHSPGVQASVLEAAGDDPDSSTLARWLDHGAPLGITEPIETNGVFPPTEARDRLPPDQVDRRTLEGWRNYSSADEEAATLEDLVEDYVTRGFCTRAGSYKEATQLLQEPVLNKLGVIVKTKKDAQGRSTRKARVIWDLSESEVNRACDQGERVILPRLLDVVSSLLAIYRRGKRPYLAGVDIRDAFMNIPAGKDRRFTVAALSRRNKGNSYYLVIFNTLVFGSASSPTLWGRMAAWLGRTTSAVSLADTQLYVDDPVYALEGPDLETATLDLTVVLLWTAITGFPVKLSKASGGKTLEWVGARLTCDDDNQAVTVSLPKAKTEQLLQDTDRHLTRPVIGARELRSYAGALSFVAGLVPHLRPFLASFWAALSKHAITDDGLPCVKARKLIHVRRIAPALRTLERIFYANPPVSDLELVTDAPPWGIGGVCRLRGQAVGYFYSHLPDELLAKFGAE